MYSNNFYPDGLTERDIDILLLEVFETIDEAAAQPTSALVSGTATRRWARRFERQTVKGTVRTLPTRHVPTGPDGQEAA